MGHTERSANGAERARDFYQNGFRSDHAITRVPMCSTFAGAGDERFRSFAAQRPAVFLVHIHEGLRQPARQTGMQLHTGTYARLLATASPLPSLRFLRQWYSLREEMR